jgi:hypothetical protein
LAEKAFGQPRCLGQLTQCHSTARASLAKRGTKIVSDGLIQD